MKMNWKQYAKIGATAVAVTGLGYILLSKRLKSSGGGDGEGGGDEDPQKTMPKDLLQMINNKTIIGKNIYSKVDYTKLRYDSYVNDGGINNILGEVQNKGTLIGKVVAIKDDLTKKINPATGKVYRWLAVKITKEVYDEVGCNKWYKGCTPYDYFKAPYVREDVISLK